MSISFEGISDNEALKRHQLLHRIRRAEQITRLELSQHLAISNSRVCDLVRKMLDDGQLLEPNTRTDRRGRGGVPVRINPQFGHLVGFDMDARRMRLAVVDFAGDLVWHTYEKFAPPHNREGVIEMVLNFIERGLGEIRSQFPNLLGIGLAAPGFVDVRRGVLMRFDLLEAARDLPLRQLVAEQTGLPCVMEWNIRALALAEWNSGAARQLESFVFLGLRSGAGVGIVIDGKLYMGSHGLSGKVAFVPAEIGSDPGQSKVLQDFVSENALGIDVEAKNFQVEESKARRAGEMIGMQLAAMAALFDPQAFVLGGSVLQPDGPLWEHIDRTYNRLVMPELAGKIPLVPAVMGPFAAAVGATQICFQSLFATETISRTN